MTVALNKHACRHAVPIKQCVRVFFVFFSVAFSFERFFARENLCLLLFLSLCYGASLLLLLSQSVGHLRIEGFFRGGGGTCCYSLPVADDTL